MVRVFHTTDSALLDGAATQAAWLSTYPKTDHPSTYQPHYQFSLHLPGVRDGT